MSSKTSEKRIAIKFIQQWNKDNSSNFIIDEEYLSNRKDNQNPDIKIVDSENPNVSFDVEITFAEDTKIIESSQRTFDKMDEEIRRLMEENKVKKWFFISINGDKVRNRNLVNKDLDLLMKTIPNLKNGEYNEEKMKLLGFSVLKNLRQNEGTGVITALGNDKSPNLHKINYYNLGYFEKLENALNRESKDLEKKNRNGQDFILVVEIDGSLSDEIKYSPIKEDEIDYYCAVVSSYLNKFKDIYIVETAMLSEIYSLKNLDQVMFSLT